MLPGPLRRSCCLSGTSLPLRISLPVLGLTGDEGPEGTPARQPCCLRDVRLYDGSPAKNTNVPGSDRIGMTSAATQYAAEGCLIGTIGLVDMPARWTSAGGIPRIDQGDTNTCERSLVSDTGL